jgi:hypothetical protein
LEELEAGNALALKEADDLVQRVDLLVIGDIIKLKALIEGQFLNR